MGKRRASWDELTPTYWISEDSPQLGLSKKLDLYRTSTSQCEIIPQRKETLAKWPWPRTVLSLVAYKNCFTDRQAAGQTIVVCCICIKPMKVQNTLIQISWLTMELSNKFFSLGVFFNLRQMWCVYTKAMHGGDFTSHQKGKVNSPESYDV